MKKILVTGAAGQIGSELVPALRERHGGENVIAAGHRTALPADVQESGPSIKLDVTSAAEVMKAVGELGIETIYHMSSILSALAESNRQIAYAVNINGTYNILEAAVSHNVGQVIIPSSIAAFGPDTPQENTPNETIQRPNTLYGISKVFGEHLGNYYHEKLGLDVRGLRLPGIISWKTEPTAGTTDYAVAIFYGAIREKKYTCYLGPHTRLPMMYMPDCIKSIIDLAQADGSGLKHHADFNVGAVSFTPSEIAEAVAARVEGFEMDYKIDPMRQAIADSWPDSLDDTAAREEWGWTPSYDLDSMSDDMLKNLKIKLSDGG
ncbi:MAG TPA: UDP-glucose 4-epimerase [Dehalococcoidia bacterium]|jgi:nucleoside-diphosphate-sugar epimerase|nr:NAD-dependent epimerase/dehydratase family protein [SAR202 cluster bacterium]HAC18923.1 UDP-glucose 4-epimerase [Dehalococcoidia bacterium]HBD83715.1 UDP-glucose 4-epimerase [Dehalococcoidia bacterium]HIM89589.1 NAD-dependent epimerase/dehydratase family protein [Dehalococcoidia bacterium]|tara:strand:+ start:5781 stop:6743 length:963 start_codon:yes stop_codon:yes gene_type:complete